MVPVLSDGIEQPDMVGFIIRKMVGIASHINLNIAYGRCGLCNVVIWMHIIKF